MNREQYSNLQRCLGKLEGLGAAIKEESVASFFYDTLEVLNGIIDDMCGEENNGT